MKGIRKKILMVLLMLVTSLAMMSACSTAATISNPALVSKVTVFQTDYSSEDGGWIDPTIYEYEYENAYPVSRKFTEHESTNVTNFQYEFSDGLPSSMTCNDYFNEGWTIETSYTGDGLVDMIVTKDDTGRKVGEQIYQYGNQDEYFTLVLHENIISPPEEKILDHMEEVDSIIVTTENGLLSKTVNDGIFANHNDAEEKEWLRFDGTYTANFDANGILDYTTAVYKSFPGSGNQYGYDLTIEDGRVTEAVRNMWVADEISEDGSSDSEEGHWEPEMKFVFEYSDVEISPSRYATMINYFLLEGGGNYYIYNWY